MSTEYLENERAEARRRLHWHLQRLAAYAAMDLDLGPAFEDEMGLAERARRDWHDAHRRLHNARFGNGG